MNRVLLSLVMVLAASLLLGWAAVESDEVDDEPATTIEGAWRWDFTMPDGTTVRPKLTLTAENGKLFGTTSFRPDSEAPITNVVLTGNRLRFQVIRQRNDRPIVTTYTGVWKDKTIVGTIESNWAGDIQRSDWNAIRSHLGAEGIWIWKNSFGGGGRTGGAGRSGRAGFEPVARVTLQQDGERLTGKTLSRVTRSVPISNGSITNAEVYFEIERTYRETKYTGKYRGKQSGDTITGTMELEVEGRLRKANWDAKRIN